MNDSHVIPVRTYVLVFLALLLLLAGTVAVAELNFGAFNLPIALAIAIAKALLVIVWFMHVRYSAKPVQLFTAAGFVWLLIMFALTLADYTTRGWAV